MAERPKRKKKEHDFAVNAFHVMEEAAAKSEGAQAEPQPEATPEDGKNPAAVALGRRGGKKGGKARAASLTPEERSDLDLGRLAAEARWKKR